MDEMIIGRCDTCDEPKFVLRDGKEFQRRCWCDWQNGVNDRVYTTIPKSFWDKNMSNWSPRLFSGDNAGRFASFIRAQKYFLMSKIFHFCFKEIKQEEDGVRQFAIDNSIASATNFFVRGPQGSGKDLLVACVKKLCAGRGISASTIPSEYSVFRTEIMEADSFGPTGENARIYLAEKYINVDLMTLQNVRGEARTIAGNRTPQKIRHSQVIDGMLAKRGQAKGSIMVTSLEFAGEIADSLGDKMAEMLASDKTRIAILLHPMEAESLLDAIYERRKMFDKNFTSLIRPDRTRASSMHEAQDAQKTLDTYKAQLYFAEAFPVLPDDSKVPTKAKSVEATDIVMLAAVSEDIRRIRQEFEEERVANGLAYEQGFKIAVGNAARSCRAIAGASDREIYEIGRMASLACQQPSILSEKMQAAKKWRTLMSEGGAQ